MTETPLSMRPPKGQLSLVNAISGPAEILIVLGASLAAGIAAAGMVTPSLPVALGLAGDGPVDFLAATRAIGFQLLVQYGVLAALAMAFGLARGRRSARSYGLTKPDRATHAHPWLYGLALGLVAGLIPTAVLILQDLAPIGQDTPFWPVIREAELTWRFYLFMAVGSFVVIPVVEEFAWRGYILGRLLEGYAPGAALILSTVGFAGLHVQYLVADAALLLTFLGLLISSVMLGFCVLRMGSIWPAVLAHAVINLPLPTELMIAKFVAGLIVLGVLFKPIGCEVKRLAKLVWRRSTLAAFAALSGLCGTAALALLAPFGSYIAGGLALVLAIGLGLVKRSAWRRPRRSSAAQ
jgi:membrane protease YdiL (CAAX protease family)